MAEKRMYSKKITDSDAFIEMASSTQALYFHLNQGADDEGFNNQIQNAMFKAHASLDDLKVLLSKNFIIRFESGVVVIKHWWIHNTLRKDRFTSTNFQEELKLLVIKDNNAYTLNKDESVRLPNGCQMVATDKDRLDKIRLDKDRYNNKALSDFLETYPQIQVDGYNGVTSDIDFSVMKERFSESKYLRENCTSLSWICKNISKILQGFYKDKKNNFLDNLEKLVEEENTCVVCGEIIPEGRQVCPNCEKGENYDK